MKQREEEWIAEMMTEDPDGELDRRERMLMESEEFQGIDMPSEKLVDIHREAQKRYGKRRGSVRLRVVLAAALVGVLVLGVGMVGSGKKLYIPVLLEGDRAGEATMKVDNTESVYSEFDEEEVCQEIEEKLGVIPIRFGYQPQWMEITGYDIRQDYQEALVWYEMGDNSIHIYICKEYSEFTINYQADGEVLDTVMIEYCGMEIPLYIVKGSENEEYYGVEFEYLNTYYSVCGVMDREEFIKIIENILLKNA